MDKEKLDAIRKVLEEVVPGLPIYQYGEETVVLWSDMVRYFRFGHRDISHKGFLVQGVDYIHIQGREQLRLFFEQNPNIERNGKIMLNLVFVSGIYKVGIHYNGGAVFGKHGRVTKQSLMKYAPLYALVQDCSMTSNRGLVAAQSLWEDNLSRDLISMTSTALRPVAHSRYREVKQLKWKLKTLLLYTEVFVRQRAHTLRGKRLEANRRLGQVIGEVMVDFFTQLVKLQAAK